MQFYLFPALILASSPTGPSSLQSRTDQAFSPMKPPPGLTRQVRAKVPTQWDEQYALEWSGEASPPREALLAHEARNWFSQTAFEHAQDSEDTPLVIPSVSDRESVLNAFINLAQSYPDRPSDPHAAKLTHADLSRFNTYISTLAENPLSWDLDRFDDGDRSVQYLHMLETVYRQDLRLEGLISQLNDATLYYYTIYNYHLHCLHHAEDLKLRIGPLVTAILSYPPSMYPEQCDTATCSEYIHRIATIPGPEVENSAHIFFSYLGSTDFACREFAVEHINYILTTAEDHARSNNPRIAEERVEHLEGLVAMQRAHVANVRYRLVE